MIDAPKVTVLIPVLNGERYIRETVESILNQTFKDFELIIVDGASTDNTIAILASYQEKDRRIQVYKNGNLVDSLNMGCHMARGKYIAHLDADDVSLPKRLEKQVQYMERHTDVGILGTWVEQVDSSGKRLRVVCPSVTPSATAWCLFFGSPVAHSSTMIRRDVMEQVGFYNADATEGEDYDLWIRASFVTKIANIPEVLTRYRVWRGSATGSRPQVLRQYADKYAHVMISRLLPNVSLGAVSIIRNTLDRPDSASHEQIRSAIAMLEQLYSAYLKANILDRKAIHEIHRDIGTKLLYLSSSTTKMPLLERLSIIAKAFRLNPDLLFSRQLIKGLIKGIKMFGKNMSKIMFILLA